MDRQTDGWVNKWQGQSTLPLGVLVHEVPLPVERVGRGDVRVEHVGVLERVQLAHVEHGRAQVGRSVRERTVRTILSAEAARVRVVHAHARLVIP